MQYIKPFSIANITIKNNLVLAPLAAVNCSAFRLLCKHYGAGLTYTQMIDVDEIIKDPNSINHRFIDKKQEENPLVVQLIGSKPHKIATATKFIDPYADIIDINFGCIEKEKLSKQSGSFLIKHPEQIDRIITAIKENTDKPITAKIRIGWDKDSINAIDVGLRLQKLGIAAIAVHSRTRQQGYSGKADWNIIKQLKQALSIPVIGNGDIQSPQDVKKIIDQTNCDAVMIGRATMNYPKIFSDIITYFDKGIIPKQKTNKDFVSLSQKFISLYHNQSRQSFSELKQHILWFSKTLKASKNLSHTIAKTTSQEELLQCLKKINTNP